MKIKQEISYGTEEAQKLDLYLPEAAHFPVFVYFHGGGLESGTKDYPEMGQYLTDRGVAFVSAAYRMFPQAKYPDFLYDAAAAVAWVKREIGAYGRCDGIYVGGSSAGGYLSMMLCFDPEFYASVGIRPEEISGYFHDAGQPTTHFNVLKYSDTDSRRVIVDERAPLYYIGMQEQYPPMHFLVSDHDMENRYEQTMLTLSTLKHFGHGEGITLQVLPGTHCHYIKQFSEDRTPRFGELVWEWMQSLL